MFKESAAPCKNCRAGLHRICDNPTNLPTLFAFISRRRGPTPETLTCCDRKEFWTQQVYDLADFKLNER